MTPVPFNFPGQAIARIGGPSAAFNLCTFTEPRPSTGDPTDRIVALTRKRYTRRRADVEKELNEVTQAADRWQRSSDRGVSNVDDEPSDPNEDDLVR